MITASQLPRLLACPSSFALTRSETHNVWADLGNDEHEALSDLAHLPDDLARHVPPDSKSEVKLAYDTATNEGRIIGEGSGRDYGDVSPLAIVGSTDVVGVETINVDAGPLGNADVQRVVIVDWKTGFGEVEPAATNGQLWFYALAACRALGIDRAVVRIVYTKLHRVDEHEIGPLELAEFAGSLRRLFASTAERQRRKQDGGELDTREGRWCKFCPAKASCPSKNAMLVQIGTKGLAVLGDAEMTPQRAVAAYEEVMHIEQLVKDAKKRLEVFVDDNGPIDLGGGRMYGRYQRPGNEKLDAKAAIAAIRDVVGEQADEFESIAIERKVTKAAIDRAAKALVVKGATKVAANVVQRIRDLGGSKRGDEYPIGEYPADKYKAASFDQSEMADAANKLLTEVA